MPEGLRSQRVALGRGRVAVGCCTVEADRAPWHIRLQPGGRRPWNSGRLPWLRVAHSDQQIFRGGCREGCRPWPWGWGGCRGAFLVSNSWPKRLWQCPGAGRPSLQGHQASWAGQAGQAAVQSRTQAGVCAHFISITVGTFARVSLRSGASLSTEFFFEG